MTPAEGRVFVVGSYVAGITVRAERLPLLGETVIGQEFDNGPGGKGSNQAIQASRLGSAVEMVARIGDDTFGESAMRLWRTEGVGSHFVAVDEMPTGVALITVDRSGSNTIAVYPGANGRLSAADVDRIGPHLRRGDVVVAQQEIGAEPVARAMRIGRAAGAVTILNPAPARPIDVAVLSDVDVLTPNATEARALLGLPSDADLDPDQAAKQLRGKGVATVIVTLGQDGALLARADGTLRVPPLVVKAVDTTGAGDAFTGTLAASLAAGHSMVDAVRAAAIAGALACTGLGVVPALPHLSAIQAASDAHAAT